MTMLKLNFKNKKVLLNCKKKKKNNLTFSNFQYVTNDVKY